MIRLFENVSAGKFFWRYSIGVFGSGSCKKPGQDVRIIEKRQIEAAKKIRDFKDNYFPALLALTNFLIALKDSGLMSCSILQASAAAM